MNNLSNVIEMDLYGFLIKWSVHIQIVSGSTWGTKQVLVIKNEQSFV